MKSIQQVSLALLLLALLFVVLVASAVAFDRYTTQPPIYKPQPNETPVSRTQMVHEATNLEGLKKVCALWAERDDQLHGYIAAQGDRQLKLIREAVTATLILVAIFSSGLFYVYLTARRARHASRNAL